jgi:hypothetical protein
MACPRPIARKLPAARSAHLDGEQAAFGSVDSLFLGISGHEASPGEPGESNATARPPRECDLQRGRTKKDDDDV